MAVTTVNLAINQGETYSQVLTSSPVVNFTGGVGVCQIRQRASGQTPVIASPTVTLSATPTDGTVTLALTSAETLAMPVYGDTQASTTTYVYDVFMTIGGVKSKVFAGSAVVVPAVTR